MKIFFKSFLILIAILVILAAGAFGLHYLAEFLNKKPLAVLILLFLMPISALYILILLHLYEMRRYDFQENQ